MHMINLHCSVPPPRTDLVLKVCSRVLLGKPGIYLTKWAWSFEVFTSREIQENHILSHKLFPTRGKYSVHYSCRNFATLEFENGEWFCIHSTGKKEHGSKVDLDSEDSGLLAQLKVSLASRDW